ncbi:MAG: hypothetical protein HYZ63_03255 [Candidatus Andersenbacteria bacterium]|nr:hypothetical protein [Candidatus Andersenbacteria bacterium]
MSNRMPYVITFFIIALCIMLVIVLPGFEKQGKSKVNDAPYVDPVANMLHLVDGPDGHQYVLAYENYYRNFALVHATGCKKCNPAAAEKPAE